MRARSLHIGAIAAAITLQTRAQIELVAQTSNVPDPEPWKPREPRPPTGNRQRERYKRRKMHEQQARCHKGESP